MNFLKHFWIFLLWLLLILYLSFAPLKDWPQPSIFQKLYLDKAVHFTMYLLLSFLLLRSFFRQQPLQKYRYAIFAGTLAFSAGLGIAVEALQPILTQYRRFEWMDMLANAIGAIAGIVIFRWLLSRGYAAMNTRPVANQQ
ncbi:MAG: VanZ family protein [Chitinophagaceae bacterium]|nr:VanZ family protein [Chitinophagaceae bacterium]